VNKSSLGERFGMVAVALGFGLTFQGCGGHTSSPAQFVPAQGAPRAPVGAMSGPRALPPASQVPDAGTKMPDRSGGEITPDGPIPVCVPIGLAMSKRNLLYVANHWTSGSSCGAPGQITVYKNGAQQASRTITKDIYNPAGLGFDAAGNLYVADASKNWVTVYDSAGHELTSKKVNTAAPPWSPSGVQVSKIGDVWVAERRNDNIGIGQVEIFKNGALVKTLTSNLVYPLGIVFQSGTRHAWIANTETPQGNDFSIYKETGTYIKDVAAPITPTYEAYAKNGNLYATDGLHNEIQAFDASGTPVGSPITQNLAAPYGIAIDSSSNVYAANVGFGGPQNGSSISKYNSSGTYVCKILNSGCKP
jgi:hypothetical protein